MIDALQVFVRGFEDQQRGGVIRDYLNDLGFTVQLAADGESDSLGGLIETDVVYQDHLEETDPDAILLELRCRTGFDGLWLQTRAFQLADEGEYGRDNQEDVTQIRPFRLISDE